MRLDTEISFPTRSEGIPDWFEHQITGDTISFWFSKKIPTITCIFLIPGYVSPPEFHFFLNGKEITLTDCLIHYFGVLPSEHAFLRDLKLDDHTYESFRNEPYESYDAFKNNGWNHVELKWEICYSSDMLKKDMKIISGAQMGIHVSREWDDYRDTEEDSLSEHLRKEKSNTEGDVVFTDPYRKRSFVKNKNPYRKRNKSRMSQKQRAEILHKRNLEKTKSDEDKSLEVSEKESLQQQDLAFLSPGMHNLVLTEAKEKHRFVEVAVSETESLQQEYLAIVSGMHNLVLTETKEEPRFVEETKSYEDKSLDVSETETVDVILSIAQMGIQEKSNSEEDM